MELKRAVELIKKYLKYIEAKGDKDKVKSDSSEGKKGKIEGSLKAAKDELEAAKDELKAAKKGSEKIDAKSKKRKAKEKLKSVKREEKDERKVEKARSKEAEQELKKAEEENNKNFWVDAIIKRGRKHNADNLRRFVAENGEILVVDITKENSFGEERENLYHITLKYKNFEIKGRNAKRKYGKINKDLEQVIEKWASRNGGAKGIDGEIEIYTGDTNTAINVNDFVKIVAFNKKVLYVNKAAQGGKIYIVKASELNFEKEGKTDIKFDKININKANIKYFNYKDKTFQDNLITQLFEKFNSKYEKQTRVTEKVNDLEGETNKGKLDGLEDLDSKLFREKRTEIMKEHAKSECKELDNLGKVMDWLDENSHVLSVLEWEDGMKESHKEAKKVTKEDKKAKRASSKKAETATDASTNTPQQKQEKVDEKVYAIVKNLEGRHRRHSENLYLFKNSNNELYVDISCKVGKNENVDKVVKPLRLSKIKDKYKVDKSVRITNYDENKNDLNLSKNLKSVVDEYFRSRANTSNATATAPGQQSTADSTNVNGSTAATKPVDVTPKGDTGTEKTGKAKRQSTQQENGRKADAGSVDGKKVYSIVKSCSILGHKREDLCLFTYGNFALYVDKNRTGKNLKATDKKSYKDIMKDYRKGEGNEPVPITPDIDSESKEVTLSEDCLKDNENMRKAVIDFFNKKCGSGKKTAETASESERKDVSNKKLKEGRENDGTEVFSIVKPLEEKHIRRFKNLRLFEYNGGGIKLYVDISCKVKKNAKVDEVVKPLELSAINDKYGVGNKDIKSVTVTRESDRESDNDGGYYANYKVEKGGKVSLSDNLENVIYDYFFGKDDEESDEQEGENGELAAQQISTEDKKDEQRDGDVTVTQLTGKQDRKDDDDDHESSSSSDDSDSGEGSDESGSESDDEEVDAIIKGSESEKPLFDDLYSLQFDYKDGNDEYCAELYVDISVTGSNSLKVKEDVSLEEIKQRYNVGDRVIKNVEVTDNGNGTFSYGALDEDDRFKSGVCNIVDDYFYSRIHDEDDSDRASDAAGRNSGEQEDGRAKGAGSGEPATDGDTTKKLETVVNAAEAAAEALKKLADKKRA